MFVRDRIVSAYVRKRRRQDRITMLGWVVFWVVALFLALTVRMP
jgi:hypothetical protein